jgi:hypothetical protein
LPKSIDDYTEKTYRKVGDAVAGDSLLIQCRKEPPKRTDKVRDSEQHHCFQFMVKKMLERL